MSYYGLSSSSSVSSLFNTSSTTYQLLNATSEYNSLRTMNSVITNLKSNLLSASSDEKKQSIQNQLDTIIETLQSSAESKTSSLTLRDQAEEDASEILSSIGIGTSINTLA